MKQLEQYFTKEFLQDFEPSEYIKHDIVDKETGEIVDTWYGIEGMNVGSRYTEPNIEEFKALVYVNAVVDPLRWIVRISPAIGVDYRKYLHVKALHSKLTGNKRNFQKVNQFKKVMSYESND